MNQNYSKQGKTTLKWKKNGELSEVDMLKILERLSKDELNNCDLSCAL